ncbi:MAG: HepT-like ribonuclease domain-containing protein [Kiloniellales bacterium]|nr:HepT-like ribonuclease domain-containing protein [Kiloniellales bacterium]
MIDAIEEALSFIHGKKKTDLACDRMRTLSLIKEIEIIGEAATKVTEVFQKKHPQIPWQVIISTRNRLIHGYFDIDLDIVWETVTEDLPILLKELRKITAA